MMDETALENLRASIKASGLELVSPDILQPADLYLDLAGEDIGRRLFLTTGSGAQDLCLRPDFTLPIAQSYLNSSSIDQKSYGYLGKIFRQRKDLKGESFQAGVEILGGQQSASNAIDAELTCIEFIQNTFTIFGSPKPILYLGSVMLFEQLLAATQIDPILHPVIRSRFGDADAMARLLKRLVDQSSTQKSTYADATQAQLVETVDELAKEFGFVGSNARRSDEIVARQMHKNRLGQASLPDKDAQILRDYFAIDCDAADATQKLIKFSKMAGLDLNEAIDKFDNQLKSILRVEPNNVKFQAKFGRRLDYYSGLVFEYKSDDNARPIAGGGRYDRLLARMGASQDISAVGCAVWLDRLPGVQGGAI